jgi:hypothetical protein
MLTISNPKNAGPPPCEWEEGGHRVWKDAQGNAVWQMKDSGSPKASPGGTKVALEILWREQKTVKSNLKVI